MFDQFKKDDSVMQDNRVRALLWAIVVVLMILGIWMMGMGLCIIPNRWC